MLLKFGAPLAKKNPLNQNFINLSSHPIRFSIIFQQILSLHRDLMPISVTIYFPILLPSKTTFSSSKLVSKIFHIPGMISLLSFHHKCPKTVQ